MLVFLLMPASSLPDGAGGAGPRASQTRTVTGHSGAVEPAYERDTVSRMNSEPTDPWSAIHQRGDADLALAFARLFWPVFVERRGCVLLEHRADDDAISQWLDASNGDPQRVEAMLNHVHLWDEIPGEGSAGNEEALMTVARVVARCWMAALAERFPGREFLVDVARPDVDYGPTLYLTQRPRPLPPGQQSGEGGSASR